MEAFIQEMLSRELAETVDDINEIQGLGTVNRVFELRGRKGEYIIRINGAHKRLEHQKEAWCLAKVKSLGIPVPEVLAVGVAQERSYMVQQKIPGINGENCSPLEKQYIWTKLGEYAAQYHRIQHIEEKEVQEAAFHKNWQSRLRYNLQELNDDDSLLRAEILTKQEQKLAKEALNDLAGKEFRSGLVHGDLSPRNVIWDGDTVFLLDWGTAEINIVPRNEIGILQMSQEASEEELGWFLKGLGLSRDAYQDMAEEIKVLNFLHQLDVYRWAEGKGVVQVNGYDLKVRRSFEQLP
jgi:aminoglycoside phosphotransferase (APT) family kinase protein